jgi:hypothetical protein
LVTTPGALSPPSQSAVQHPERLAGALREGTTPMSTCPACAIEFTPRRGMKYCRPTCRKRAQDARHNARGTITPEHLKPASYPQQDQQDTCTKTRDVGRRTPSRSRGAIVGANEPLYWDECRSEPTKGAPKGIPNPCTQRVTKSKDPRASAVGWLMQVEGRGWFGRVGKDFSFGPTSIQRARSAVEDHLRGRAGRLKDFPRVGDPWLAA